MQIKEMLLEQLLRAEGKYCSGGELAEQFGVSRTAVWKAIEQLKAEGCAIEAVTNKGYRLTNADDLFDETLFRKYVKDCRMDWNVVHLKETDSTNNYAKKLAAEGAPEGTVVLADRQTAGKGRLGKSFHSPSGGLYMSVILRPRIPLADMMAVTACTAVAVHEALREIGFHTQIKWVNDLFLNGRKICGILTEGSFNAELLAMDHLVIGIGINLRCDPDLPDELRSIVTDLEMESGSRLSRTALFSLILTEMELFLDEIQDRTYLPIYREHSCTLGHRVLVITEQEERIGLAVDFAEDAGLIVEFEDGSREIIRSGTAKIVD